MRLDAAFLWGTDQLAAKEIDDPQLETELLLTHALNLPRLRRITAGEHELDAEQLADFERLIERRANHEPTAYIIGEQPFLGLDFFVDRDVLIPRPETELLVEKATALVRSSEFGVRSGKFGSVNLTIADIGTGSGCIAVSLAKLLPGAKLIAVDSSAAALAVARKNARRHQVEGWIDFRLGNMFETLQEPADLIVSNPPYIPSAEIDRLQPEVKEWEPRGALDGGKDGLDFIRQLMNKASDRLLFEFGFGQAIPIKELAGRQYGRFEIIRDYSGLERIFSGVKGESPAARH